jgi:hypothetical protein
VLTGELHTIDVALTTLADRPAWSRGDGELVADCEALQVLEHRLAGVKLLLLGELYDRDLARDLGATSTIGWLRWRLRVSSSAAGAMVRLARALRRYPATARRLAAGEVSVEQARVITDALAAIPDDLPEASDGTLPADAVSAGVEPRAILTSTVTTSGDATVEAAQPSAAPADQLPAARIIDRVEALLLDHAASLDPRGLRVAGDHALAAIAPQVADDLEQRTLTAAEHRARAARHLDLHDDAYGGAILRGYLDQEAATVLRTVLDPLTLPRGAGDERTAGQRRADALVEICGKVMSEGLLPAQGSQPTQLVVTTNYDTLTRALGVGITDRGERLSPTTVRRLACNAKILPAVMDSNGQVLDLGRSRRLFTGAIRQALNLRDGGCTFPGCDRPNAWVEGHHIQHWLDGGATDQANAALVCTVHHHLVHDGGWQIRMGADGHPEFIPPPWIDPDRTPLRNNRHHINRNRARAP